MSKGLTLKQERFVNTYIATGNASEAVRQAYNPTTPKTVTVMASENLAKPSIKQAIEDKKQVFAKRLEAESLDLLDALLEIAKNPDVPTSTRVKAIIDLLDRAGLGAKQLISTDVTVVSETRHTREIAKRARKMMAEKGIKINNNDI